MARQRFIWPDIWKDPVFGSLNSEEKVFFIACFSLADDEGRLLADAPSLRGEMFRFSNHSLGRIKKVRDSVVAKVPSIHLYTAQGQEYIALLKWSDYQRPKYPTPSKIPPPFLQASPRVPPILGEGSSTGWDGLGRDGLVKDRKRFSDPVEKAQAEFFEYAESIGLHGKQRLRALQLGPQLLEEAVRVTKRCPVYTKGEAAYFDVVAGNLLRAQSAWKSDKPLGVRLETYVQSAGHHYDDATLREELALKGADALMIEELVVFANSLRAAA